MLPQTQGSVIKSTCYWVPVPTAPSIAAAVVICHSALAFIGPLNLRDSL